MLKTKKLLTNTIGSIIFISIIFFFFTYWLYLYNKIDSPLKETWTLTISMFSTLATIGAAIIAASLFSNWRDEHNHNLKSSILLEYLNRLDILEEVSTRYLETLKYHSKYYSSHNNSFFASGTEVEVFIEVIEYYHKQYYEGGFASWTNANKFSLLDDLDFKRVYLSINGSLNKGFEVQYKLKSLLKSKNFESISEADIQKEIDLAIEEVIKVLDQIEQIRYKAISEIKAKN